MSVRFAVFMAHATLLQTIVLALRIATSYQAIELGLGALELGLISAGFALLPLILAVPLGRMIDDRGDFLAILAGALGLLIAIIAFNLMAASVLGLLMSTIILGSAHFLSMVGQHSYVASNTDATKQDSQFGWYAAAISFGQMIGPMAIAALSNGTAPDLGAVYLVCVPLAFLHLSTLILLFRSGKTRRRKTTGTHRPVGELLRIKGVWLAILAGVAVMSGMDLLTIYLPLLGIERNIDASIIAALVTVRAGFTLLSRASYGYLVTKFDRGMFLSLTIGSAGLACIALVVPLPTPLLFAAVAVFGFGLGAALPITLSWISEIAPSRDRGMVFSLRQSVLRASQVVIPLAGGGLAALTGIGSVFFVLTAFLCMTAIITRRS